MGISIETHRLRIGLHALRVQQPKQPKLVFTSPYREFCLGLSMRFVILMMGAMTCMICAYASAWKFSSLVTASNFAQSMKSAFTGSDVIPLPSVNLMDSATMLVVRDIDLRFLLLLSGVEPNPGPDKLEKISQDLKELGSNLKEDLRKEREEINKKSAEQFDHLIREITKMASAVTRFEESMSKMQGKLLEFDSHIEDLNTVTNDLNTRIEELENRLEDQERRDRRDNLLIFGAEELGDETNESCLKKTVSIFNQVLPGRITDRDITRAHRLGRKSGKATRPIIVRLQRSTDKISLLSARDKFHNLGYGVAGDLTRLQRSMVQQARNDGMVGYFSAGKFYTKPRQQTTLDRVASLHSQPDRGTYHNRQHDQASRTSPAASHSLDTCERSGQRPPTPEQDSVSETRLYSTVASGNSGDPGADLIGPGVDQTQPQPSSHPSTATPTSSRPQPDNNPRPGVRRPPGGATSFHYGSPATSSGGRQRSRRNGRRNDDR